MGEKIKEPFIRDVSARLELYAESVKKLLALSEKAGEEKENVRQTDLEFLYKTLRDDVCVKCPRYRICFGENIEKTTKEIGAVWKQTFSQNRVDGRMASEEFRKSCVFFQAFMEEIEWMHRLFYQNNYWKKRQEELRKLMRRQIASQYTLLCDCSHQMLHSVNVRGAKRHQMKYLLLRHGFWLLDAREYVGGGGDLEVCVEVRSAGPGKAAHITKVLTAVYKKTFFCRQTDGWIKRGTNYLTFVEEGCFHVLFGKKHCSKQGENICGDTFSFAGNNRNRAVMVLSDGMGVGAGAYDNSRRLLETFEAMMEAGIHEEYALEMLHNSMCLRGDEEFSTLDISVISLRTGTVKILKAGGTATFIKHGDSVERICGRSLPPGCLPGQEFDIKYKKLYDGDMIVMVSDGMLDFETLPDISFSMENVLEKIKTKNAQVFANELMEAVPVPPDGHDDDRTVLVAAVWERGQSDVG